MIITLSKYSYQSWAKWKTVILFNCNVTCGALQMSPRRFGEMAKITIGVGSTEKGQIPTGQQIRNFFNAGHYSIEKGKMLQQHK